VSVMRRAETDHPVLEVIAGRWSPRAISPRPVEREKLASLFEAARWAPSSFNEQPWRYVLATREKQADFDRLAGLLVEGNAWARQAGVLALSVAKLTWSRNGKPNRHALHDVGAASLCMFLQATSMGLFMHEMAGFDVARARAELGIPDDHEPVAMIAIGYPGDPASLAEPLRASESAPRCRQPITSWVLEGDWKTAASF
jgi:nitroreductase